MSFSSSRFKGSSCSGWISGGPLELPWCQIKYKGSIPWCLMSFSGEKRHQWSFYTAKPWKSQENTCPPRIQEENFGFNFRFPKLRSCSIGPEGCFLFLHPKVKVYSIVYSIVYSTGGSLDLSFQMYPANLVLFLFFQCLSLPLFWYHLVLNHWVDPQ